MKFQHMGRWGTTLAAAAILLTACTDSAPPDKPLPPPVPAQNVPQAAAPQASPPAAAAPPETSRPAEPAPPPVASAVYGEGASPADGGAKPQTAAGKPPSDAGGKPAAGSEPPKPAAPAEKKQAAKIEADRTALSWYYMKKKKGMVPDFPADTKKYTPDMKALWVGTGKKVYLTIDAGGPMGDMELLRKSLKDNDAKANFFIAGYNMKKYPEFIRQLVDDGHLVANHTMTHTDMNLQTDEQVKKEIDDFAELFKETTGKDVPPFFRFPYGRYNMHLLKYVSDMGYTSVFWSTAMVDWLPRKNGPEDPLNDILNNLHDGNIILMHEGSPENIEALDSIIKKVREAGYEFGLVDEIAP